MKRIPSLDVLRGIAIILVIGNHADYYHMWRIVGWTGVHLFFVLSGFLIAGLLFAEHKECGSINLPRFFWRRGFKIWPSYYALLGFTIALYYFAHFDLPEPNLMLALTFLGNYFQSRYQFAPVGHIWSLAVEEHFYIVLPLLLIVLCRLGRSRRDPFRAIPYIFAFSVVFCLVLRALFIPLGTWTARTDMLFDSLLGGVTLSYFYHFRPEWFAKISAPRWLFLSAALFVPMLFLDRDTRIIETFGLTSLVFAFSFLVAWSVSGERWTSGIIAKGLAKIGSYSYSIYLWHFFLSPLVLHYKNTFYSFWLFFIASISVGIFMANLIELPCLALRDRWMPKRPRVTAGIVQPVA